LTEIWTGLQPSKPSIWLCPCNECDRFGYGATSVECAKMVHVFYTFPHLGLLFVGLRMGLYLQVWIQTKRVPFLGLNKSRRRCGKKKTRARTHGDEEGYDHDPSMCFPFLSSSSSSSSLFDFSSTPMELIANSVRFFFVFLSNKIRKCSVFVLIGTC